jgi:hypothetical protein
MDRSALREEILRIAKTREDTLIKPVATPEWPSVDGYVYVRKLSVTGRERYLDSIREVTTRPGQTQTVKVLLEAASAKLAAATMCDREGNLLFTIEDVKLLGELSYDAMQRVIDESSAINGLDEKAALEQAKNFSSGEMMPA